MNTEEKTLVYVWHIIMLLKPHRMKSVCLHYTISYSFVKLVKFEMICSRDFVRFFLKVSKFILRTVVVINMLQPPTIKIWLELVCCLLFRQLISTRSYQGHIIHDYQDKGNVLYGCLVFLYLKRKVHLLPVWNNVLEFNLNHSRLFLKPISTQQLR